MSVQSVDLSALGAQALAQVEKARKAAAESLASALNQKPKLDLTLELDAPKIAIPVPATEDGRGMYAHLNHYWTLISTDFAGIGNIRCAVLAPLPACFTVPAPCESMHCLHQ